MGSTFDAARGALGAALLAAILAPGRAPAQYIPPPSKPQCIANCGDQGQPARPASSGGASSGSPGGILVELVERLVKWGEEASARRRAEARALNEKGIAAHRRGDAEAALRLFREAEDKDPDDATIRQNVRNAEAALAARREEQRRQAALAEQQRAFQAESRKLAAIMPAVRVVPPGAAASGRARVPPPGFPPEEWRAYLLAQDAVDVLYAKLHRDGVLSDADARDFYDALRRRNALWVSGQARPLSDVERERLRLTLPLAPGRAPPPPPRPPDPAPGATRAEPDGVARYVGEGMADQFETKLDDVVKEWVEEAHGKKAGGRFEKLVGLARVAMRAREDGAPGAGAELADFTLSRIPEPMSLHGQLAVEGGRQYANVAFRALDRFMVDAMAAVGQSFDPEAFRKSVKADMNTWQKGGAAWVTGE